MPTSNDLDAKLTLNTAPDCGSFFDVLSEASPQTLEGYRADPVFRSILAFIRKYIKELSKPTDLKQLYLFNNTVQDIIKSNISSGWPLFLNPNVDPNFSTNQRALSRKIADTIFPKVEKFVTFSDFEQLNDLNTATLMETIRNAIPDAPAIHDPHTELKLPCRARTEPVLAFARRVRDWCEVNFLRDANSDAFRTMYAVTMWTGHFRNFRDQCVFVQESWQDTSPRFKSVDAITAWFAKKPILNAVPESANSRSNNSRYNNSRSNKVGN